MCSRPSWSIWQAYLGRHFYFSIYQGSMYDILAWMTEDTQQVGRSSHINFFELSYKLHDMYKIQC